MAKFGKALTAVLSALLVAACSPQMAEAPATPAPEINATHPVSGLQIIPVSIALGGSTHTIQAELAATPQEQTRGLMFRTEMGADEGMLFDYGDDPKIMSFWMKNTVLPLDIVFISPEGLVVNVAANTTPYSTTPILSDGIASAALELNAGRAAELGIVPGVKINW